MTSISVENVAFSYPLHGRPWKAARRGNGGGYLERQRAADRICVLEDLSFKLGPGDRLAIIGRNGAGKSTLLRLLAGILPPDRGSIIVEGQLEALFTLGAGFRAEATGLRNIVLRGLVHGLNYQEINDRIPEIAEFAELGDRLELPLKTYSTGMVARLALATVTSFRPDILLLDEWIGAGDALFRKKAQQRVREFVEKAGILVVASHNQQILRDFCNLAIWLEGGRVVASGELGEIVEAYEAGSEGGAKPRREHADDYVGLDVA